MSTPTNNITFEYTNFSFNSAIQGRGGSILILNPDSYINSENCQHTNN
jgi:hypothetical protein